MPFGCQKQSKPAKRNCLIFILTIGIYDDW